MTLDPTSVCSACGPLSRSIGGPDHCGLCGRRFDTREQPVDDEYAAGLTALTEKHNRQQLELDLQHLAEFVELARRTNPARVAYWERMIERRCRSYQKDRSPTPVN